MSTDIHSIYKLFLKHSVVSKNSRNITPGSIFFALKGTNDGNEFAHEAIEKGASYAIIDNPKKKISDQFILVDDVLNTLQKLSAHHRKQLKTTVICIAGSNGKTTTKELIYKILNKQFKTFATIGNLNNHIGVPEMLLRLTDKHEFAVIEIGANHLGENYFLSNLVDPDYLIITNSGKDHLGEFGGIEGVIQSNKEICDHAKSKNIPIFINSRDQLLLEISNQNKRILFDGLGGIVIESYPFLKLDIDSYIIDTHLFGRFQQQNINCAIAVARHFGVDNQLIKEAIEEYTPQNLRSEVKEWKNNILLLDCYNANPSSMSEMITDFSNYKRDKKIAVLGDMLEMGVYSEFEHKQIIDQLRVAQIDKVILVGEEFAKHNTPFTHFLNNLDLKDWLDIQDFSGWFFMIKGSRSLKLEVAFGFKYDSHN